MEFYRVNSSKCFGGKGFSLWKIASKSTRKKYLDSAISISSKPKKNYPPHESGYRLYEQVGFTKSATVHRALCIGFNEIVAIKIVDLNKCSASLDEISYGMRIGSLHNHPNILKVHCSFVVEHCLWIVMPYMSGGSCFHTMRASYHNGFEETVVAAFLAEVLKGLFYLHSQGQTHKNVKAANILVDVSGAVALGDCCFSSCIFDNNELQNVYWMAPEIKDQTCGYSPKADIWSIGIAALELSYGDEIFINQTPMKVIDMSMQKGTYGSSHDNHRKLSKSFLEMISMCLAKDPTKRPSTKKLLKHTFFQKSLQFTEHALSSVLDGLPSGGDQLKTLKLREENSLDNGNDSYVVKDEQSQNDHNRRCSSWNFELDDTELSTVVQEKDHIMESHLEALDSIPEPDTIERSSYVDLFFIHPNSIEDEEASSSIQEKEVIEEHVEASLECAKSEVAREKNNEIGENNRLKSCVDLTTRQYTCDNKHAHAEDKNCEFDQDLSSLDHHGAIPLCLLDANTDDFTDPTFDGSNSIDRKNGLKTKVPVVQQKGRFKVTSEDTDLKETLLNPQAIDIPHSSSTKAVTMSAVAPFMQRIAKHNDTQRDQLMNLIKSLSQGKPSVQLEQNYGIRSTVKNGRQDIMPKALSERERELLQQLEELENRVSYLVEEIHRGKVRNLQLERQLKTVCKKEETKGNIISSSNDFVEKCAFTFTN